MRHLYYSSSLVVSATGVAGFQTPGQGFAYNEVSGNLIKQEGMKNPDATLDVAACEAKCRGMETCVGEEVPRCMSVRSQVPVDGDMRR
jgi:hypothetical protein